MHANYPKKATPHGRNARLRDLPHQQIFFILPQFVTSSWAATAPLTCPLYNKSSREAILQYLPNDPKK
jgi:hypothetical protein